MTTGCGLAVEPFSPRRPRQRLRRLLARPGADTAVALADQAVVSGFRFLSTIFVGRFAGPDDLGMYSIGFNLLVIAATVQESLLLAPYTVYGPRLHGQHRAEYAGSVLVHFGGLVLAATLVLAAVAAAAARWAPPGLAGVVGVLCLALPFVLGWEFARRYAFAHLRFFEALLLDAAVAAVQLAVLATLAWWGRLSAVAAMAGIGAATAAAVAAWWLLRRGEFRRGREVRRHLRQNWRFARWIVAAQSSSALTQQIVLWLLATRLGVAATGLFAACMTIVLLSNPFILGVSNVLAPKAAAALVSGGAAAVRREVVRATLLLGSAMTAFALVVAVTGEWLIRLLYGGRFQAAGPALVALAAAALAAAWGVAADNGLLVLDRPDVNFRANLLGLILTAAIAAATIGPWGVQGAACGLVAGNLATAVVRCLAFARLSGRRIAEERSHA